MNIVLFSDKDSPAWRKQILKKSDVCYISVCKVKGVFQQPKLTGLSKRYRTIHSYSKGDYTLIQD